MKSIITAIAVLLLHATAGAQAPGQSSQKSAGQNTGIGLGIKAGVNFANVNSTSALSTSNVSGYMIGGFLSSGNARLIGFRTEFIFSHQGYDFKTNTNTGNVSLNYFLMPQLMTLNITRFVQLQAGAQIAFLLNAKADSTKAPGSGNAQYDAMMENFNKINYGFAGGIEIRPWKGILVGARYNFSRGDIFSAQGTSATAPSFLPDIKKNLLQVFAGYRF